MKKYPHHISSSYAESANKLSKILKDLFQPSSVLDVGCGVGLFLKNLKELGVNDVLGLDSALTDKALIKENLEKHEFKSIDLNKGFKLDRRYDLCICLEVAEHLEKESADTLVRSLCEHSDMVIFSAAIPFQGGIDHINEQWPSYWIKKFADHGYECHDILRPMIWNDATIEWWYRQNCLIFSRSDSQRFAEFESFNGRSLVHPEQLKKYEMQIENLYSGGRSSLFYLKGLIKSIFRS